MTSITSSIVLSHERLRFLALMSFFLFYIRFSILILLGEIPPKVPFCPGFRLCCRTLLCFLCGAKDKLVSHVCAAIPTNCAVSLVLKITWSINFPIVGLQLKVVQCSVRRSNSRYLRWLVNLNGQSSVSELEYVYMIKYKSRTFMGM